MRSAEGTSSKLVFAITVFSVNVVVFERYGYDVDADDYFSESSPKVFQFSLYLFSFYA
jgi:hypothetical protein